VIWTLGVDFGLVSTAAALGDPAGGVDEVRLSARDAVMPSAVFVTTDGLLVGQRAEQLEPIDPQAFDRSPKLRLSAPTGGASSQSRAR
jgi:hypothetical protein